MKRLLACALLSTVPVLSCLAATPAKPAKPKTPPPSAASKPAVAAAQEEPAPTPAPAAAPAKPALTLDAYIAALADDVPLSKDEQTDVKTYYLNDGAKLQEILNAPSLSPMQQQQQVDDLRHTRNSKIEALLKDVGRQQEFLKVESNYRVALVELAAEGGLVPSSPTSNVPQPTATTPAQADAATQATTHTEKADSVPGQ